MTKRELVLHLLREAGPRGVTTAEFLQAGCGSRFGARVQELRDAGHVIGSRRVRAGSHVYVLQSSRLFESVPPAPTNALCWDEAA
jgi:hypothetical protein